MNKPGRLREALLKSLPDLAQDPQKLSIFVERGNLVATGAPGQSWEYRYQVTAVVQDFAGDMDEVAFAIMQWVAVEQPDLLKNDEGSTRGIRFQCEMMTSELVDILIELDLREAAYTDANGTRFDHPAEPPADPTADWIWMR
jgi:hypothetical protein